MLKIYIEAIALHCRLDFFSYLLQRVLRVIHFLWPTHKTTFFIVLMMMLRSDNTFLVTKSERFFVSLNQQVVYFVNVMWCHLKMRVFKSCDFLHPKYVVLVKLLPSTKKLRQLFLNSHIMI